MKSVFGTNIIYSVFGESHNEYIGMTIHGLKAGIKIDDERIKSLIDRRKPSQKTNTLRIENDEYQFISGVFNGYTNGDPVTFLVKNEGMDSSKYQKGIFRPGQSDYAMYMKTKGFNDYRGGGHLSGRLTLLFCIAYGIIYDLIANLGISITSNIIYEKNSNLDTTGGIIEVKATNIKPGIGEPLFFSVESVLSQLFFSIPSVKAVEFGLGKDFSSRFGSETIDEMQLDDDKVIIKSNNNGGINGGITNGNDIISKVTFKPISTLPYKVNTIDYENKKNIEYINTGKHDLSIINRVGVVLEAMMAIGLLELITLSKATND